MPSTADTPAAWPPVVLPDTQARLIRARSNGSSYSISLWVPPTTPPPEGFPVVYVLDANALFGTFVDAIRRSGRRPDATGIRPAIVVGIAHPGTDPYALELRRADYTTRPAAASTAEAAHRVGGADAFLSFIEDELIPTLRRDFPLNEAQQMLFGHSLAGFFVLHALMARAGVFQTYAAISPSIWWNEPALRARLPALAGSSARVLIAVGEWEGIVPPWQRNVPGYEQTAQRRDQRQMIANARKFAAELQSILRPHQVMFREFPDEDHASILLIATHRALRFALAPSTATIAGTS